jgi:hypothetical protein
MTVDRLRWLQLAAWIGLIAVFFTLALKAFAPGLAALGAALMAACVILQFVLEARSTRRAYNEAYTHWAARRGPERRPEIHAVDRGPRVVRSS